MMQMELKYQSTVIQLGDHADVQGRQFSNEEYKKLSDGEVAKDYKGISRQLGHSKNGSYRHISEYNCYHKIFPIVLGVSKPEYTDKQLKEIQEKNERGFEFEGKHYTNYQGTQLCRRVELEIRKAKDTQILARASGDDELVLQSQGRITKLTNKYREILKASGLPSQLQRASVSGYRRVAKSKLQ